MISLKTPQEIAAMRKGGKILAETVFAITEQAKPGVSELELDALAEKLIREKGGEPAFQHVPGYHHAICASTNNVIVHGIPTDYVLKNGDVFGVDCGVIFEGLQTDMAETIIVGGKAHASAQVIQFLDTGKKALEFAIKQVKPGNRVGHISKTIQMIVEDGAGYGVTRELIGHGVGYELHEDPEIPGYLARPIEKTPLLKEGMTIAIEVIYNMGSSHIAYKKDGWTIVTEDGSLSGLFERTVAVTENGVRILTSA
ncbi:MAG TPA: type I methionyl aminopeptidase [Patescibacteria group bacterium]|nr:type I methionyl aminopeptidase [Patescibacteria group bacterium]